MQEGLFLKYTVRRTKKSHRLNGSLSRELQYLVQGLCSELNTTKLEAIRAVEKMPLKNSPKNSPKCMLTVNTKKFHLKFRFTRLSQQILTVSFFNR